MTLIGYFFGFFLGFIGYFFLGNINLTVVQISLSETRQKLQWFILFVAVMEFIYCFASLMGLDLLLKQTQLIAALNWSAVGIFLLLGFFSVFYEGKVETDPASYSHVRKGVLISIFNPLQIPFWLVCGVYVMQNSLLKSDAVSIAIFSLFCAFGTIAILTIYAIAGKRLVEKLNVNKIILNRIIGILLIVLAVFQAVKIWHTDAG